MRAFSLTSSPPPDTLPHQTERGRHAGVTSGTPYRVIGADYAASKHFYCDILRFTLLSEVYREERGSGKPIWRSTGNTLSSCFLSLRGPHQPPRPAACAIWRSALTTLTGPSPICRRPASPANRSASILIPNPVLPFQRSRWFTVRIIRVNGLIASRRPQPGAVML